jgi:hypothetical protein
VENLQTIVVTQLNIIATNIEVNDIPKRAIIAVKA